jgi:stage II sporulation protein M
MSKKFSFVKIYSDSWKYIKSCRIQIYSIISLFFVFVLIGFFVPISKEMMNFILEYVKQILEQTKDMSMLRLMSFIFLNNLQASFLGLILGFFFGIFPVFFAIFNGYILGIVASLTVNQEGVSSLLNLFPHGIFELPAVFISLGIGLKLGAFIFQKNKKEFFKKNILNSIKVFLFVVLPLLFIAAIIEGALIFLI